MEEIFDYCVLEYSFAIWQWGTPMSQIPDATASDKELFNHLIGISEPGYFTPNNPNRSFNVQAARELGYYGYDIKPFKSGSPSSRPRVTCIVSCYPRSYRT